MTHARSITVTVPATTANLGPGFDCLGAALNLYNRFTFTQSNALEITATGRESGRVALDCTNLAYRAFKHLFEVRGSHPPAIRIAIELGIPLARGLGSSATAIVGGLLGANELSGGQLSQDKILALAIALEGHPDNVVPALLGACQLTVCTASGHIISPIPWHHDIVPIVAIPDFDLSTAVSRSVLPKHYRLTDAVFSASRIGLLIRGLETGNQSWLRAALQDKLHQPYRKTLISSYDDVHRAALEAGAYGLVISGAGPTVLALSHPAAASRVAEAVKAIWQAQHVVAEVICPTLDRAGAQVTQ